MRVECPKNEWTKVATGTTGSIYPIGAATNPARYFVYWIGSGKIPPFTLTGDGARGGLDYAVRLESIGQRLDSTANLDIYVYAQTYDGAVLVDGILGVDTQGRMGQSAFNDLRVSSMELLCGWTFPYNINLGLIEPTTNGSGTVSHSGSFAVLSTGTDADGVAQIQTIRASRYIPGVGSVARFTAVFDTPQANSQQLVGIGDELDGWFFGYDGLLFGIMRRNNGFDTWTYQAEWSDDVRADLDPTKGNVYEIKYQWLGFGMQYFSVEDQNGNMPSVHRIQYANKNTDTSIQNPNLPLTARVENTGNTTDIVLKTPSAMAAVEGFALSEAVGLSLSTGNSLDAINGVGVPIISLYSPTTYLGKNNRLFVQASRLNLAAESTKPVTFRVLANAAPTDGTFDFINEQLSPVQVNKTMTTFTNGIEIGYYPVGRSSSNSIDITGARFLGYPGQYFTIVADTSANADVRVGINFRQFL